MEIVVAGKKISNIKEVSTVESIINDFSKVDQAMTEASKACEAFAKFSDTKTIESFGYKATEAVGENIANGAKFVAQKIVQVAKLVAQKISQFIQWIQSGMLKMKAQALLKQIVANPNLKLDGIKTEGNEKINTVLEAFKSLQEAIGKVGDNHPPAIADIVKNFTALANGQNFGNIQGLTKAVSNFVVVSQTTDVKQCLEGMSAPNLKISANLQAQANFLKQAVSNLEQNSGDAEQQAAIRNAVNFSSKYVSFILKLANGYLAVIAEGIKAQQEASQPQQQNAQPVPAAPQQPTAPVNTNA